MSLREGVEVRHSCSAATVFVLFRSLSAFSHGLEYRDLTVVYLLAYILSIPLSFRIRYSHASFEGVCDSLYA